jgi:DNA-binding winged helix-turn-helix (wHTH) protein/TolB-like protein
MSIHIVTRSSFQVGDFTVLPMEGVIEGESTSQRLEPVTMNVLLALVKRAGEVVTRDEVITVVWKNQEVKDDSLTRCISELRAVFGDDPKSPQYIETIPKRGYRLVAPIGNAKGRLTGKIPQPGAFWVGRLATGRVVLVTTLTLLVAAIGFNWVAGFKSFDARRIAVMPLLDFRSTAATDQTAMSVAHGLRESLALNSQLRVVPTRTTVVLADEALSIRQIASELDARWIVEGSLRSGKPGLILGLNLIDGQDEYNIYARRYTLSPDDEEAILGSLESFTAQVVVTIDKATIDR